MKYGNAICMWLPLGIAVTGVGLLVYIAMQQGYRQALNDPQIQIAEDAAMALAHGGGIENILWRETPLPISTSSRPYVDIATSLSPWTAYYAPDGTPLESTGLLHGSLPDIPKGVFQAAASGGKDTSMPGEDRVTWQPEEDVRQALIIVKVPDASRGIGYVVAGRNMREVEDRESRLGTMLLLAWAALMIATLGSSIIISGYRQK